MKNIVQTTKTAKFVIALVLILIASYYLLGVGDFLALSNAGQEINAKLSYLLTVSFGIIFVSLPFLALGSLISVIVELCVSEKWLLRLIPRNRFGAHIVVSLLGMLMPVCECGNVPVARRLMMKGFSVSQSVTFLLAAPVINVVTLWSTWEAFGRVEPGVVVFRVLGSFVIANFIGILLSFKKDQNDFLTPEFIAECAHDHHHHHHAKWREAIEIFRKEFVEVFKMLILGALIVGVVRAFVPNELIVGIGSNAVLSVIAMIMLGYVIAICSSIDAFLALALADRFTMGAVIAFLVSGPMVDIKIFSLLRASFKPQLLIIIASLVTLSSLLLGLIYNLL